MPAQMRNTNNENLWYMTMDPWQLQHPDTRFGCYSGLGDMNLPPYIRELDPSNQAGFPREGTTSGS